MKRRVTAAPIDVEVVATGDIPASAQQRAGTKLGEIGRYTREPVLHARVRLSQSGDPAMARPVIAQANVDVNGRLLRAQVTAPTAHEAVGLLAERLRRRLAGMARHWEARRGRAPGTDAQGWRHLSVPAQRPGYFPRPEAERQVVRRKTFGPAYASVDEAAFDMDLLDHDFYLFTDAATGEDSVIYRAGPTGYRLAQVDPRPGTIRSTAVPATTSHQPAPRLTEAGAIHRLNATGLPFLFFAEPGSNRGRLLYRRYDGHYGLIKPAG
jgi:ribosome-associated translation inhibitor RaiA